jgi:putative ABC transport system permease protein
LSALREIRAVIGMSLLSLPQRLGPSLVIVLGIATVVGVFISVLAMATGYRQASLQSGREDRVMILSTGANTEAASNVSKEAALTLANLPGVRRDATGRPLASFEILAVFQQMDRRSGLDVPVTIRGMDPRDRGLRPEIRLVAGRYFRAGVNEVIAGRGIQQRIGIKVGDRLDLPQGPCEVVGLFESDGDAHESELHTDGPTLAAATQFMGYHSGTLQLESAAAFETFKQAVTTNPALAVVVKREARYFAEASQAISSALTVIAWFIGGVMTFGAVFGALNIMYSAVSRRGVEIATLRALGFRSSAIVLSVLAEALALALIGAAAGAGAAWLMFNGDSVNTAASGIPSQLTYSLRVTAPLIALGVLAASVIGIIGGLFPALRAARLPVAQALRGT